MTDHNYLDVNLFKINYSNLNIDQKWNVIESMFTKLEFLIWN